MNILFLLDFFLSGQTLHVLERASHLHSRNIPVHLGFGRIQSPTLFFSYLSQLPEIGYSVGRRELMYALTRFQPSLVHIHSSTWYHLGRNIALEHRIPYGITLHGLGIPPNLKYPLEQADFVIGVGPFTLKQANLSRPGLVMENGVDLARFTPVPKYKASQIFYVGRMEQKKLYPLRVLSYACYNLGLSLFVVSDYAPSIPHYSYLPWQTDLASLLNKVTILLASGRTAREGLAARCCVLLMNHGYDGIITEEGVKDPSFSFSGNKTSCLLPAVYRDLRALVWMRNYRKKVQRFSRQYACEHLDTTQKIDALCLLYEEVLKKGPTSYYAQQRRSIFGSPYFLRR